jgi:hypothetical protein
LPYPDPFELSPSSSRSNSPIFVMHADKLDLLWTLMGTNFIQLMNRDDFIESYQSLSDTQWLTISIYVDLANMIDGVSNIRRALLDSLEHDVDMNKSCSASCSVFFY